MNNLQKILNRVDLIMAVGFIPLALFDVSVTYKNVQIIMLSMLIIIECIKNELFFKEKGGR